MDEGLIFTSTLDKLSQLNLVYQGSMVIVNMHDAKTHLSRLVDQAVRGESFIIAKAGKPMVRVEAVEAPTERKRLGFMIGEIDVPDDFDAMSATDLASLFGSSE